MNHGPVISAHAIDRYIERIQWMPSRKQVANKLRDGYFDGYRAPWSHANARWNRNGSSYRSHAESGTHYYLTSTMVMMINHGKVRTVIPSTVADLATALTFLLTGHWIDDCEEEEGGIVVEDEDDEEALESKAA